MPTTEIMNNNEKITEGSIMNLFHEFAQNDDSLLDEISETCSFDFSDDAQGDDSLLDEISEIERSKFDRNEQNEDFVKESFQTDGYTLEFTPNDEDFQRENFDLNEQNGYFQMKEALEFAPTDENWEESEFIPLKADVPNYVFENTLSSESCTKCCLSKCFNRIFPLREILVSGVVTCHGCPLAGVKVKIAGEKIRNVITGKNGRFSVRIVVCDQVSVSARCHVQSLTRTIYFPKQSETVNFNFN